MHYRHGGEDLLRAFIAEAREKLDSIVQKLDALESRPRSRVLRVALCRDIGAVASGAGFLKLEEMRELCDLAGAFLAPLRDQPAALSGDVLVWMRASLKVVRTMLTEIEVSPQPAVPDAALHAQLRAVAVRDCKPKRKS